MKTQTLAPPAPPFGPPAALAGTLVTTVPAGQAAGPLALYRALLAERGPAGTALLESAGPDLPTTRRSVVVARAALRLELRGTEALVRALDPAAEPLAAALADRVDALGARRAEGALSDAERLTLPGPLDVVRAGAGLLADDEPGVPLAPGLFGAFSYELVDRFEELPARRRDPQDTPDASFVLAGDTLVFDHRRGEVHVVTRALPNEGVAAARARHADYLALLSNAAPVRPLAAASGPIERPGAAPDVTDERFLSDVETLRGHIDAGDIFQAVLSRGFSMQSTADPLDVYAALRAANPSPYLFHLDLGCRRLLGASPETFLRVEDGNLEIRPIAGTVPRGFGADGTIDADLDRRLALQLLLDEKERAEHAMLLDLARNDVARVAEPGTTEVVQQFEVERYSHVQHLVSRVRGRLRGGLDALHAYRAVANMGTLTGAPKLRAMELIRELEPAGRGFYGGAAGFVLQDGSLDTCIVIRSLLHSGGTYSTRAGAGVVWDSDPASELAETAHKARACLEAVARAERLAAVEVTP
ncbi:MAG: anthranilate synthase component I family protein [Planctomycetota bacterium]